MGLGRARLGEGTDDSGLMDAAPPVVLLCLAGYIFCLGWLPKLWHQGAHLFKLRLGALFPGRYFTAVELGISSSPSSPRQSGPGFPKWWPGQSKPSAPKPCPFVTLFWIGTPRVSPGWPRTHDLCIVCLVSSWDSRPMSHTWPCLLHAHAILGGG